MAKTTTCPLTQNANIGLQTLVNADSIPATNPGTSPTNTKLLYTAGADGSVVKSIILSSDDSSARYVSLWYSNDAGSTKYLIGTVAVAATAGMSSTGVLVNIDVLGNTYIAGLALDQAGRPVLNLPASTRLYVSIVPAGTAVTASKTIWCMACGEDF